VGHVTSGWVSLIADGTGGRASGNAGTCRGALTVLGDTPGGVYCVGVGVEV
jgi:hypothetical protein